MKTFKHLTLMAAIFLGIQGLGASVHEEEASEKPKTSPAAEAVDTKAPEDTQKGEDTSNKRKKTCQIL